MKSLLATVILGGILANGRKPPVDSDETPMDLRKLRRLGGKKNLRWV